MSGFTVVGQAENSAQVANRVSSMQTAQALNLTQHDRMEIVVYTDAATAPTLSDTVGNTFSALLASFQPQSGYYVYVYEVLDCKAEAADIITATNATADIIAITALQLRGLSNSASAAVSTNSQGNASGADAITGGTATPASQPAAVIGFSMVAAQSGPGKSLASTGGTGFTAQTGVWATLGGGAGDYMGCWETMEVTSTSAVAATWTQTSNNQYDQKGSITLIVPEASGAPVPTVTSVNGGSAIPQGATAVPLIGTGFAAGMTVNILQGGNTIAQAAVNVSSSTAATFTLVSEPGTGGQLKYDSAGASTTLKVVVSGQTSAAIACPYTVSNGQLYTNIASINSNGTYDIQSSPALAIGDQVEASGSADGTAVAPSGLQLNTDTTYQFSGSVQNFYARAWDASTSTWGAWALQTAVSGGGRGGVGVLSFGNSIGIRIGI